MTSQYQSDYTEYEHNKNKVKSRNMNTEMNWNKTNIRE